VYIFHITVRLVILGNGSILASYPHKLKWDLTG